MFDAAKQETLLEVNNIEVIYNHVILVLKGVSLTVPKGGITALAWAAMVPARQRRSRRSRTCCTRSAER